MGQPLLQKKKERWRDVVCGIAARMFDREATAVAERGSIKCQSGLSACTGALAAASWSIAS